MFGLSSFRTRQPDAWQLQLGFSHDQELKVAWNANDSEAAVLAALHDTLSSSDLIHEDVRVQISTGMQQLLGVVAAAGFGQAAARLSLSVQATRSLLTSAEITRTAGSSSMSTSIALALWNTLEVAAITRLCVADGGAVAALTDARVMSRFKTLRVLNLSHAGLGALPPAIGLLSKLQELNLVGNQLRILPPEIGKLTDLRVLAADSNQLTILPGELRKCMLLRELTLQHNRLTSVLLSFASLHNLSMLHLYDNPLEFLPEISPCTRLHHLTVANLRVTSDPGYTTFQVEVLPLPPGSAGSSISYGGISLWDSKQADKLRPIFTLMLRRSSGHHPLLAGALRCLAEEDTKNRELMAKQENGLQQLVLMALADNNVVVKETCRTLTLLAEHSPALAEAVVENDAAAIMRLLPAADAARQLSTLELLAALAYSSPKAAAKLATVSLLRSLQKLVDSKSKENSLKTNGSFVAVRTAALKALGNLAFCSENRRMLERSPDLMQQLSCLALSTEVPVKVQAAALRVLAILGKNELVRQAVGKPPIQGRGLRILSLDGGGMKGIATVRLLRELERHTGQRVHEMFDLIVGTSTGGLLAVALGLKQLSLDDCTYIYKVLGQKVFSRTTTTKDGREESWMESFYRTFQNKTSHVRAVVVGYKHDAAVYESLLQDYCDFSKYERCVGDAMIDTAGLHVPKVALVSTLSSVSPAPPFVFRNYQPPSESEMLASQISAHAGSCKHPVWQAVRASSAASFYLEDFSCGGDKFQDGAVTANNPTLIGLQEARLLWPEHPVEVVISLGVGLAPPSRREKGLTTFMETGAILIESSTSVSRVEEAAATLLPLVPGLKYFRFRALDPRCAMELDEIDPERWAALEAATDDYIAQPDTQAKFAEAAEALAPIVQADVTAAHPEAMLDAGAATIKLGMRRKVVLLRAPRRSGQAASFNDAVAATVAHLPECVAAVNLQQLAAVPRGSTNEQEPQQGGGAGWLAHQAAAVPAGQHLPAQDAAEPAPDAITAESGSLSAYLSSWFGSPPKQPKQKSAAVPCGVASDAASSQLRSFPVLQAAPSSGNDDHCVNVATSLQNSPPSREPVSAAIKTFSSCAEKGARSSLEGQHLLAKLEEQLVPALPSIGVVHLGLEAMDGAQALVLRWKQHLHVVAEPSEEASGMLRSLGLDPQATKLADIFAQQPSLQLSDRRRLSMLSSQTQWVDGEPLSMLLLSMSSPELLLRCDGLGELTWLLRGQLVVCSDFLPAEFQSALLVAGAKGVVCRSSSSSIHSTPNVEVGVDSCCSFFSLFYERLQAGNSVAAALQSAEKVHAELQGVYTFHAGASA